MSAGIIMKMVHRDGKIYRVGVKRYPNNDKSKEALEKIAYR